MKRPGVGLAVLVWRDGKIILTKRHGSHGANTWCAPGGHLEAGESWEACAKRETMEEVGVEIENVRFVTVTNDIFESEDKHYITIVMEADWKANEPESKEPDKVLEVGWFALHDAPSPMFEPCWTNLRAVRPDLFA